jgi:hypothetical protein
MYYFRIVAHSGVVSVSTFCRTEPPGLPNRRAIRRILAGDTVRSHPLSSADIE